MDSVRFFSMDIDIRTLADFLILKTQGLSGLTRDLEWLYSYVEPHLVRRLKQEQFILLTFNEAVSVPLAEELEPKLQQNRN